MKSQKVHSLPFHSSPVGTMMAFYKIINLNIAFNLYECKSVNCVNAETRQPPAQPALDGPG